MAERRRRNGTWKWHFCGNCSNYPTSGYTTQGTGGEQCDQCLSKKANGNCS